MHGPPLVGWLLVVTAGAAGVYWLVRTYRAGVPGPDGAGGRGSAASEALTGLGMAAMAVPAQVLDPRPAGPVVFTVLFAATGLRSLLLARRPGRRAGHAHHAVEAAAMVYMALAMAGTGPGGHHGPGPAGLPVITGALVAYFTVAALCTAPRLVLSAAPGARVDCGTADAGAVCKVTMAICMVAMLLAM